MSALHRNALLPDTLACLRCGEPVRGADDYCPACDPSTFAPKPVVRIEAPGWLNLCGSIFALGVLLFWGIIYLTPETLPGRYLLVMWITL